jgi:hypothetical protein
MRAGGPVLDPPHVQHRAIEFDLVPAQVADLSSPESVPEGEQDHCGIAVTVAVGLGGLDQGFDLAARQVLAGAKLDVSSTGRCRPRHLPPKREVGTVSKR